MKPYELTRTSGRGLFIRFTTWPDERTLQELASELHRHRGYVGRLDIEVRSVPTPPFQAELLHGLTEALGTGAALWHGGRRVLSTGDYLRYRDPLARRERPYLAIHDPIYRS